ncbi:nuclear transport factor 2 family protein [soil metagenome]
MSEATPETIEAMVRRLSAFEDLRQLRGRYWRYVDTKRWSDLGELFIPEAHFLDHIAEFECNGRAEIVERFSAALETTVSVHIGQQSELELLDDTHARGIWAMQDHVRFPPVSTHPTMAGPVAEMHGYGHYVDSYVRVDGVWKFASIDLYRLDVATVIRGRTPLIPDFTV